MDSIESLDIEILTFVTPHLFYVTTDIEPQHRNEFLQNLSLRIKKKHHGPHSPSLDKSVILDDEIVAVEYKSELVRATVVSTVLNDEHPNMHFCWLIDYAVLIKTDKVFKIPKEIQKITPRCRQASLNNICYLREQLDLGVTGTIKTVPTIVPSTGVIKRALELISDYEKVTFIVAERLDNILIGEVVLHKNGKEIYLTKELCSTGLLTINNLLFRNLKYSTKEFFKTHLTSIFRTSNSSKKKKSLPNSVLTTTAVLESEQDEIDVMFPLKNGRRRRTLNHSSSGSVDDSHDESLNEENQNVTRNYPVTDISDEKLSSPVREKGGTECLSKSILMLQKIKARMVPNKPKDSSDNAYSISVPEDKSINEENPNVQKNDTSNQKIISPSPEKGDTCVSQSALMLQKARMASKMSKNILDNAHSVSESEDDSIPKDVSSSDTSNQRITSPSAEKGNTECVSQSALMLQKMKARMASNKTKDILDNAYSESQDELMKVTKAAKAANEISKDNDGKKMNPENIWKKLVESKRKAQRTSSCSGQSEEEASVSYEAADSMNMSKDESKAEQISESKSQHSIVNNSEASFSYEAVDFMNMSKDESKAEQISESKSQHSIVSNSEASVSYEAGNSMNMSKDESKAEQISKSKSQESTVSNSDSPFASITSKRKVKPKGIFLPAGMESTYSKTIAQPQRSSTPKQQKRPSVGHRAPARKAKISDADEDCPTIKIPKPSDSLTDDQISAEEIKEEKSELTSSSDTAAVKMFTKTDFCRLVAGCTCTKCRVALEEDDWDAPIAFESDHPVKKKPKIDLVIKPRRLLKQEVEGEASTAKCEILSINYQGMSSMEKKLSNKVLVHGESIPVPIRQVAQVNIHKEIHNNISRINYRESKRIQHYAFPAITRNQHVFMVNDQKSGKTMAYLPILISFIMEKEERYSQLFKMGGGPIVVILCSNSKKCEEIHDLTSLIMGRQNRKYNLVTYPGYGNISNVDILITMPTVLSTLISARATNFKRLCHLVLEDADEILKSHDELIKKYFSYADQVLEHRNCPKSLQLILCAQHWTNQMEDILMKLEKAPTVCIGNYLEAALYGKLKFTIKFLDTGCKEQTLQNILKDKYTFTKSVIICNQDEVEVVQTFLTLKGIEFTSFVGTDQEEDILFLEAVWNNARAGKYSVLVCTDEIYNTMNITSAHLLIHFSLPHSWSQFIRRFSCFLENIQTPLDTSQRKIEISSYVFIDENCEERMSKFSNFIKIANLEKVLPQHIKTFFEGIRLEEENKRLLKKIEICQTLRLFGKCDSLRCKKRHILDKNVDSSDYLPINGTVKFQILTMTDAGTCSIRLLEQIDLKGQSVRKFEDLTNEIAEILAAKNDYHSISKAIVSHLYLHKDKEQYFRCRLLELDDFALVYLIDRGIYCKSDINGLYKMPEELKCIPPLCYEVHLANLVPPFDDTRFSRLANRKAQTLVDCNCLNSVMSGTIVLQLGSNLWLEDVYEERAMHDKSLPTIGFQLSRELVKRGLAVKDKTPLEKLYKLCKKSGFELPEYETSKQTVRKVVVEQVQPNWAFLDVDGVHEVIFTFGMSPNEFYIRQNKFTKQLMQLEQDIQKEIRKPFYPSLKEVEIGKCYLVKDQVTGAFSRGIILSIENNFAEVLCVDYGDVIIEEVENLKHISNEMILKLPFQSIQCSMFGIKPIEDEWTDDATDLLYKIAYQESNPSILRALFVRINSSQDNILVKRQKSYVVTLKDGLRRRLLINELLIDCGFAIPNGDEIKDFDLPEVKSDDGDDEDSVEEIIRSDDEKMDEELNLSDLEVVDFDQFLKDMNMSEYLPPMKTDNKRAIEEKKGEELPPLKAAPPVDYLTPVVWWSETDSTVKLSIKLSDVADAQIRVRHNRNFHFSTTKDGKKYVLNLLLFAKVENTCQHTVLGSEVRVTLKKCASEKWPRLLYTTEKVRKIHYDISSINLNDDEEKRKLLDLGISDTSSEDEVQTPYFVCSDLDSEYDWDIPNDEAM